MGARLVFMRNAQREELRLSGPAVTIGRSAECEFQIADERISSRHCRLWVQGGEWLVQDLRSTNRTYINGEPVGDDMRRMVHGDVLRLGGRDAVLFEAQFVADERYERNGERRAVPPVPGAAQRAAQVEEELRRRIAELEAAQRERNAELVRLGALCKSLQAQLGECAVAAVEAGRARAMMDGEIEALQQELTTMRTDHASRGDELERAHRRCADLEARLVVQERKTRAEREDGERNGRALESKLRLAESELQAMQVALATARENVRTLEQAYEDAQTRPQL